MLNDRDHVPNPAIIQFNGELVSTAIWPHAVSALAISKASRGKLIRTFDLCIASSEDNVLLCLGKITE